ncbi:hypothetical protein GCM10009804_42940 [Kribbella hippodromi]|uniref:Uncharacterized protein n=1 Tax=Kribbella hippodromi TaxID=434347 RepID=A0ABN2DNN0_9ACTN
MARGLIRTGDPCFPWADSVAEAVSAATNRLVRWREIDVVVQPTGWTPREPFEDLRMMDSPLFLTEDLADAVRDAYEGEVPDQAKLVQATGYVMSQAAALSTPEYDNIGGINKAEAYLNTGLGDVFTQERLGELWSKTDSGKLLPAEQVADFGYAARNPEAAAATRALMTEIVRQQGGTPAGPEDFAALSNWMLAAEPDRCWEKAIELLPGTDELSGRDRLRAERTLEYGFTQAVEKDQPEHATEAVRTAAEKADPLLRRLTQDPALAPAQGAANTAGVPAGYVRGTINPNRDHRGLG